MSVYLDTDIEVFHLRPLMLVELSWVELPLPLIGTQLPGWVICGLQTLRGAVEFKRGLYTHSSHSHPLP